jgi:hypothetical protein
MIFDRDASARYPPVKREVRVRKTIRSRGMLVKRATLILGAIALSFSAFAAGIDSRAYTCPALQSLIAAKGFVFISQPAFGDFVVANVSYCEGGGILQLRSVPTTDNPECLVNYCVSRGRVGSGGGM